MTRILTIGIPYPHPHTRGNPRYFSIGAPYIAVCEDWVNIATNWTNLMPYAVERNHGNLAEM